MNTHCQMARRFLGGVASGTGHFFHRLPATAIGEFRPDARYRPNVRSGPGRSFRTAYFRTFGSPSVMKITGPSVGAR